MATGSARPETRDTGGRRKGSTGRPREHGGRQDELDGFTEGWGQENPQSREESRAQRVREWVSKI